MKSNEESKMKSFWSEVSWAHLQLNCLGNTTIH